MDDELLDLFSSTIFEEDNNLLCIIPSEAEIVQALSSLGSSKAHGLDGFNSLFYKKYWSTVKRKVLD